MGAFEYRQAQDIRDCFRRYDIRYLFLGKSGAILLGFPDTTQDAHLFVEKTPLNCAALVRALREMGFALSDEEAGEVTRAAPAKAIGFVATQPMETSESKKLSRAANLSDRLTRLLFK